MQPTAQDIATRAREFQAMYIGVMLALPPLLDPATPLVACMARYGQTADSPVQVVRKDGTVHSTESVGTWLRLVSELRGDVMARDLMSVGAIQAASRLGDMIDAAGLRDPSVPLLEFARHYRNACAHGDRWHFVSGEPRRPAVLRGRALDANLHGTRATYDWVGPGDHMDFLDDIAHYMDHL